MNTEILEGEIVDEQPRALAVQQQPAPPPSLFGTEDPLEVLKRATEIATMLSRVVEAKKLYKEIGNKKYLYVEAWQTMGAMMGLSSVCEWSRPVEGGWEAAVVVQNRQGAVIARAEGQCTKAESSKRSWDDYAIRSMAQTRTTSKAYRSVLAFVVVLAGYQATPADEMPDDRRAAPVEENLPLNGPALYTEAKRLRICEDAESFCAWAREIIPGCENLVKGAKPSIEQRRAIESALKEVASV